MISISINICNECSFINSRPEVFCKKGVLRNFRKLTGKHLCQGLFFNKVVGLRPATLLKKRLWQKCFSVNCVKFLRTLFLTEDLWWLLVFFISLSFRVLRLGRHTKPFLFYLIVVTKLSERMGKLGITNKYMTI